MVFPPLILIVFYIIDAGLVIVNMFAKHACKRVKYNWRNPKFLWLIYFIIVRFSHRRLLKYCYLILSLS